jgi:hypothetical protein
MFEGASEERSNFTRFRRETRMPFSKAISIGVPADNVTVKAAVGGELLRAEPCTA